MKLLKLLLTKRIVINKEFLNLIDNYRNYSYEVGGMLFGYKDNHQYYIDSFSFKKGDITRVEFTFDDMQLYYAPTGMYILGTWHLHPNTKILEPSIIDKYQWYSWGKQYVHILLNQHELLMFDYRGRKIGFCSEGLYERKTM